MRTIMLSKIVAQAKNMVIEFNFVSQKKGHKGAKGRKERSLLF